MTNNNDRKGRSNEMDGIFYPVAPMQSDMPEWYADMLQDIIDVLIPVSALSLVAYLGR